MRLSFSPFDKAQNPEPVGQLALLAANAGQSENFDELAACLKSGLERLQLEGCFLMSCFGFNRETRFGGWQNRYVFPLRSDLTATSTELSVHDDLIVLSSGYFTLVVGNAKSLLATDPALADTLLMLTDNMRLWVKGYTQQVDQEFDALNHRKVSCKQLSEVVRRLDESGKDLMSTHHRVVTAINAGVPPNIISLGLTHAQQGIVMDEFDELARAYSIFTKQQMELNRELKEQVRSVAGFLLASELGHVTKPSAG